jgi:hypothetical protein
MLDGFLVLAEIIKKPRKQQMGIGIIGVSRQGPAVSRDGQISVPKLSQHRA